jgi:RNA polymerase sigma-70 factor (ECF subfamily)
VPEQSGGPAGRPPFDALLYAAKRGDGPSVAVLFHDLHPRINRYLRGQEPNAADDIEGDVWEAIARGLGDFTGSERDFSAWAFTIARRRIIDQRRRTARRRTDVTDPDTLRAFLAPDAPDVDAIERLSAQDAIAQVTAALSEEQAEVVLLRVLAGLDAATVGDILGRTENWVWVTQHRALRKLATRLGSKVDVRP